MGQSNKPQTIGYRYFMGIHMSLCRGPINELREIRVGDRTAWRGSALGQARWLIAASSLFGGDEGEGGIYGTIDMMLGTETQPVNPRLKRMLGSALVPAFRGMTTLFFDGLISSMNPYPKPWAFRARRVTAGWDDDNVWYPEKALIWQGNDTITSMNPAHIIYEAFTNREWGRGRSAARIHDASFRAAADQLYAEGFGLCICWRRQEGLGALVKSVIDHINAVLLDDLVTGQVALHLIRDDYVVDDLPLFDEDSGLLGIDEDDAADGAMATNDLVVKFTNMMNQGADDQVRVQNNAAIQSVGSVLSETVQYPHVPTSGLAGRLAQRDLAAKSAAVRRFKVRLDRRGAEVLPGKAFRIRSLKRGYEQLVLRAGQCDYGTLEAGTVTISAVIDAYGLPDTAYVAPQPPTVTPPTADPLPATVRRIFEIPYRDLVHFLTPAQMAEVTDTSCAVGVIARRPSAAARAYTLLTRVGSAAWGGVDTGDWCPTAQIATALDYLTTTTRITYGTDISTVQSGVPALIDDEIVRVVSLDIDTGDLVIARGCSDTVPAKHAAGARIWFYESDTAVDPVDYAPGVTVQAKVQTRTSTGLLDLELAPIDSHLTGRRQARPYPPGNLRINGEIYPDEVAGDLVIQFSHRDRLQQADQLVDTTVGNIGPEAGTTYIARLFSAGGTLISETPFSGNTVSVPVASTGVYRVAVSSVRSGVESFQGLGHRLFVELALQMLALPLTYDEEDADGVITWERNGAAPHVTPLGFEGDGYQARLKSTSVPSWLSVLGGATTLHASIRVDQPRALSSRDAVITIGANSSGAVPRLEIAVIPDPSTAAMAAIAVRASTASGIQSLVLGRPQWHYERAYPLLAVGSFKIRPQAILFDDATSVVIVGHAQDTQSLAWRIRLSDGAVIGEFTFGTVTYRHVAALARRSNGDVWATDYDSRKMIKIDLEASFATGSAVINEVFDTSVLARVSGLNFVTVAGTEYALVSEYAESGTPYLYVIAASSLGTSVFNVASRYKRFSIGLRIQGHDCNAAGKLWVSRNVQQGVVGAAGYMQAYDIQAAITSSADGASLVAEATHSAPSQYPQDIAFHPGTGHVWTSTEGLTNVVDLDSWLSIWSSPLDGSSVFNHYTVEYNGADQVDIKINSMLFDTRPWTINQAAEVVSVGGLPLASAGFLSGFSMARVANVIIQNAPLDEDGYAAAVSGSYEPNTLTVHNLTLTNPGAELGSTSGWTVESGAMAVRSANPPPFEGGYYFAGGNVVSSVSRQRLDLVAQGVPGTEIDAGACWAKIRWQQSAYSDQDPGGMGLRTLTAAAATIATTYSGLSWVPHGGGATGPWYWYPRSLPVPLAANTRLLDALYNASGRTSGTANDHYVDVVSVMVYER